LDKLVCSHRRAWEYYAESILASSPSVFKALECFGTAFPFDATKCTGNPFNVGAYCSMGYWAEMCKNPLLPNVNYYVDTNSASPYSKT
jgi:hypothetical protein